MKRESRKEKKREGENELTHVRSERAKARGRTRWERAGEVASGMRKSERNVVRDRARGERGIRPSIGKYP